MITRRQIIVGAVGATVIGIAAVQTTQRETLARALLQRMLGPFDISEVEFQRFAEAIQRVRGFPSDWKIGIFTFAEQTGLIDTMIASFPTQVIDGYARWRRIVMTDFMLATNFLDERRPAEKLSFTGLVGACSSPFAEFS